VIVDKPDRSQIQIFIGHPTIAANDPLYFPLTVTNTAFGGFFNSRYNGEIRVKRGWTYSASSALSLNRDAGVFYLRTFTAEANLGSVIRRSLEMLRELANDGLTAEELKKAKSHLINEFPFLLDTPDKLVQEELRNQTFDLPGDYLDTYRKKMEAVGATDVRRAAQERLTADNVVVVAVCEAKKCEAALRDAIDSLASVEVVPYDKI
jgi:zinc protease